MKLLKNLLVLTLFLFITPNILKAEIPLSQEIERRAAFDIGSGKIKMAVADVDLKTNQIVKVIFTDMSKVTLREDLAKSLDGKLSDSIQNKAVRAISELMKKASQFEPKAYHGVATEALRLAINGEELVQKIKRETGLDVTIISQEEEGILGFLAATSHADLDPEKAVVLDRGSGSFQVTAKSGEDYIIYMGKLGKVPMKNAILEIQDKEIHQSPNPISREDCEQALSFIKSQISDIPEEILEKLRDPEVTLLGMGNNPVWGMQKELDYSKATVFKELKERFALDDRAIMNKDSVAEDVAPYVVSNLILAYGIMDAFGMEKVHYVGGEGANAAGAILSPKYWK